MNKIPKNTKLDINLLKQMIKENIESQTNQTLHNFLHESKNYKYGDEDIETPIDRLISRLDKDVLRAHVNINGKII